jgi:quercetin dioxygenase-like cupin family protein
MPVDVYQPFTNPVTKETFRCLSSTDEAYTMEWIVEPGGHVPFEHIHVNQDEVCHIQRGEMRASIDRREQVGKSGQSFIIPRGIRHIAYNDTPETLVCMVEYKPGLDVLRSFQCFAGLTHDGDLGLVYGIHVPKMMYFMKKLNIAALVRPAFVPEPLFYVGLHAFLVLGNVLGWESQCRRYTGQQ